MASKKPFPVDNFVDTFEIFDTKLSTGVNFYEVFNCALRKNLKKFIFVNFLNTDFF